MADLFIRTYTFVDGTTAYGSQVEAEIGNIVDVLNNLNTAATNWGIVSSLHATSVPLIADCSSGTQHIADFKNNSVIKASVSSAGALTFVGGTSSAALAMGSTKVTGLAAATANGDAVRYEQVLTGQIVGTTTNDSATAGNIGEAVRSFNNPPNNFPATTVYGDGTSITLTAGDWDVTAMINVDFKNITTVVQFGISTTTGNSSTGLSLGDNLFNLLPGTTLFGSGCIAGYRVSISSTTIHYLKITATFTGTAPQYGCRLSARRMR